MRITPSHFPEPQWAKGLHVGACFAATTAVAPVAAQFAAVQVFNPLTANGIIRVMKLLASKTAAGLVNLAANSVALTTRNNNVLNLTPGGPGASGQIWSATLAALSATYASFLAGTALTDLLALDSYVLLRPGQGIQVEDQTANEAMTVTVVWASL